MRPRSELCNIRRTVFDQQVHGLIDRHMDDATRPVDPAEAVQAFFHALVQPGEIGFGIDLQMWRRRSDGLLRAEER